MNRVQILLAALFDDRLDYTTTVNAVRLILQKPLLEKGGRDGGATGGRGAVDKTALQYIKIQATEEK